MRTTRVQTSGAGQAAVEYETSTVTGLVKWFSPKGFGFIARPDGEDVYVHHSAVTGHGKDTLVRGTRVRFAVVETERGPEARNVVALY